MPNYVAEGTAEATLKKADTKAETQNFKASRFLSFRLMIFVSAEVMIFLQEQTDFHCIQQPQWPSMCFM